MKVGLFIPCYIDQFYPQVGIASLQLLEKLGVEVHFPENQTCCGQPLCNAGFESKSHSASQHFVNTFAEFDYIVTPSGSCALHVQEHFSSIPQTKAVQKVRKNTKELCEFLVDVLGIEKIEAHFPHKIGLHQSCHGLRGLHLAKSSELVGKPFSKIESLLKLVSGLELVELNKRDECCGFGGTFAIDEPELSAKMGKDRLQDHAQNGAEYITSVDMSCLMHLDGLLKKQGSNLKVIHVAEILNGGIGE